MMSTLLQASLAVVGKLATDAAVTSLLVDQHGQKLPRTSDVNDAKWVELKKLGLLFLFQHDVGAFDYPVVPDKKSYVPYCTEIRFTQRWVEAIHGVTTKSSLREVQSVLGAHTKMRRPLMNSDAASVFEWVIPHAGSPGVWSIRVDGDDGDAAVPDIQFRVPVSLALERYSKTEMALFTGWLSRRKLFSAEFQRRHGATLEALSKQSVTPTSVLSTLYPRGIWTHFVAERQNDLDFHLRCYRAFHNMNNLSITNDCIRIFGKRVGPHGHDEPALDTVDWSHVDQVMSRFDEVLLG
jgi:hypothetical protein